MALPGETEAGSAGKQPCRGIARRAHRDDDHGRGTHLSRSSQNPIGSKDPDALKIPARRAASTLTRSARSPVPAEPAQLVVVGAIGTIDPGSIIIPLSTITSVLESARLVSNDTENETFRKSSVFDRLQDVSRGEQYFIKGPAPRASRDSPRRFPRKVATVPSTDCVKPPCSTAKLKTSGTAPRETRLVRSFGRSRRTDLFVQPSSLYSL